jgi:hypothetical protein
MDRTILTRTGNYQARGGSILAAEDSFPSFEGPRASHLHPEMDTSIACPKSIRPKELGFLNMSWT